MPEISPKLQVVHKLEKLVTYVFVKSRRSELM